MHFYIKIFLDYKFHKFLLYYNCIEKDLTDWSQKHCVKLTLAIKIIILTFYLHVYILFYTRERKFGAENFCVRQETYF
jgi:uncharacterized membrane protein YbaN (DUF454 family)